LAVKDKQRMKPQRPPLKRIWYALLYSKQGLLTVFRDEAAFRQELLLFLVLLIPLYFLPLDVSVKMLLLLANTLVLITELVNSAIEAVIDLVSPEYNTMAKKAKDMGSAAVFLALALSALLWLAALGTLATVWLQ
jgi:diacylglycerol kinase (ATP)